jgi:hypothetical protein
MNKALWENESLHEAIISATGSRSSECLVIRTEPILAA